MHSPTALNVYKYVLPLSVCQLARSVNKQRMLSAGSFTVACLVSAYLWYFRLYELFMIAFAVFDQLQEMGRFLIRRNLFDVCSPVTQR